MGVAYAMLGNYLRVRGEYGQVYKGHRIKPELPPRARRIPCEFKPPACMIGTTSACAENTYCIGLGYCRRGNYLRVRGEYPK